MIVKMAKIRIFGPREFLIPATALLQKMGCLHIETPTPRRLFGFKPPGEDRETTEATERLERLLDRIVKTLLVLPPPREGAFPADTSMAGRDPLDAELDGLLFPVLAEGEELHRSHKELQEETALLRRYERVIRALSPLIEKVPPDAAIDVVGITVDRQSAEVLELMSTALDRITGGDSQILSAEVDRDTMAALLIFGRSYSREVRKLLLDRELNELTLPRAMRNLSLREALLEIRSRLETLPGELDLARSGLEEYALRWRRTLEGLRDRTEEKLTQFAASRRFLCSKYCFVIEGWIPRRELSGLQARLEGEYGGSVTLEVDSAPAPEETPVQIRNPPAVRPFEVFTRLLPLPLYGTVDPTPFMAFFFPIFFGLTLGDIGYGALILLFSLILRARSRPGSFWNDLSRVFLLSSLFAILFGVLFGEFFSTLGESFHLHRYLGRAVTGEDGGLTYAPLLFNRVEAMTSFLLLAVLIGALHVLLGLLLGMVSSLRRRLYGRFLFKASTLLVLLSVGALLSGLAYPLPAGALWTASAVLAVGLVCATLVEGLVAPIEMVATLGNVLSYARIMAIGLASVILGLVANRLGALPDNVVVGVLIAATLHAVNIVLGLFSPTIHSMRLHFVEFFGKFFEGGGKPYRPFRRV